MPDLTRDSINPEKEYGSRRTMPAARPLASGKPAPEVMMNFLQAAAICGLGEIGLSGQLLTRDFGPFQRVAFLLTDAELTPDPIKERKLCDACGDCLHACYGQAFEDTTTEIDIDGTSFRVAELNRWQCAVYYAGARQAKNPFMPDDALAERADRAQILAGAKKLTRQEAEEVLSRLNFYGGTRHSYAASICGRACDRACYIHLEQRGVLSRSFSQPFRTRPDWFLENHVAPDEDGHISP